MTCRMEHAPFIPLSRSLKFAELELSLPPSPAFQPCQRATETRMGKINHGGRFPREAVLPHILFEGSNLQKLFPLYPACRFPLQTNNRVLIKANSTGQGLGLKAKRLKGAHAGGSSRLLVIIFNLFPIWPQSSLTSLSWSLFLICKHLKPLG